MKLSLGSSFSCFFAFQFHCGESKLRVTRLTADFQLPMPFIGDAPLDEQLWPFLLVSHDLSRPLFASVCRSVARTG
jgi:hypothetical protein